MNKFDEAEEVEEFEDGPVAIPDATADPEAVGDAFNEADPILSTPTAATYQEALPESGEQSEGALGTFNAIAITGDVIEMQGKELVGDITVLIDTSNEKWAICPEDPQCVERFDPEKHLSTGSSTATGDAGSHEHANLGGVDATEQADLEQAVSEGRATVAD